MQLSEYQRKAMETILPQSFCLEYLVSGLAGEVGEVASLYAKSVRDGTLQRENLIRELGDVLWFVAVLSEFMQEDLSQVAAKNVEKLRLRKQMNTIQGSGDYR